MLDLMGTGHFPEIYSLQKLKENSYIIMEKLDHNLEELFLQQKKKFSLATVALVTEQCFAAMRQLHEAGYLHRDLKPENFMIKATNTHQIKLIDFGLSDGMRVKRAITLIGNVRFSSRDAHFGYSSRKDDLESLIFVLFYLLTGSLPWQTATKEEIEQEINRRAEVNSQVNTPILRAKHDFIKGITFPATKNEIKKVFFSEFTEICRYIFELPIDGEPKYTWISQRCERLLLLSGTRRGQCFDWCRENCSRRKRQELWDIFQGQ